MAEYNVKYNKILSGKRIIFLNVFAAEVGLLLFGIK